jgi:hypothetical protein
LDEEPEEEYPSDLNPSYNFSFDVKDDELTNYQNRQEEREGGVTKGSYSVVDPDGYVRTVKQTFILEASSLKLKLPCLMAMTHFKFCLGYVHCGFKERIPS